MKKYLLVALVTFLSMPLLWAQNDSIFIRKIFDEALERGHAYENLRQLCKDIGARLTGSAEADMAVRWGEGLLKSYGFDKMYLQEVQVPHWERGTKEAAWITDANGNRAKLDVLALGGSVGTNGLMEGEVLHVEDVAALQKFKKQDVEGKVVFISKPFDQKLLNTFQAYGACHPIRGEGTKEAGKLGAKAVVIRSLASSTDDYPHTGSLSYEEGSPRIPGAAMSTKNADLLVEWLQKGKVTLSLEMDCRHYPDKISYNVIGEMTGKDEKIISFGGHLDSWDAGEGAHDDGAGVVHSIEALRILKKLGYKPNHTLRAVLFMNEENGNRGGITYAKVASEKKEQHICAIESDRGGFLPLGFDIDGSVEQVSMVQDLKELLSGFELNRIEPGFGGVDIGPLREYYPDMVQIGLFISSQRYFDFHHSPNDVFENVNKRELELGAAAMTTIVYLMDQSLDKSESP